MFWELQQQKRILDAQASAESAQSRVERYADRVEQLQRQVDQLSLACQAMWELLRTNTAFTDEDLEQKMTEIDGRDGAVDGKMRMQTLDCPSCGRKTNSRRNTCIICGAPVKRPHQFGG